MGSGGPTSIHPPAKTSTSPVSECSLQESQGPRALSLSDEGVKIGKRSPRFLPFSSRHVAGGALYCYSVVSMSTHSSSLASEEWDPWLRLALLCVW